MFAPVYFDHNASTPLDPAALEAMLPYLSGQFGNASSRHEYGRAARRAIDEARAKVAAAVGAHPTEVVFTSGGSEANNLLIKGAAACLKPGLLAVSAVEHPCVIKPAEQLAWRGWTLEKLPVDVDGRVDAGNYQLVMAQRPKLVSVMLANNETGVLQDVAALAAQARARRCLALVPGVCRIPFISLCATLMAKRWSGIWIVLVLRSQAVLPVRVPTRSRRMCCAPWVLRQNWHAQRCA